jgi:tetratricopeptide (TPR) repeat protein
MAFSSASVRLFTGEITAALTRYVEAEHRGEAIGDREMVAGAAFGVGFVTQFVGSAAEALGWADRALDMCGDDPDFGSAVWSYGIRGPSLCVRAEMLAIMGRLADAAADAKRATEILRVRRDPEWLCYALTLPSKLAWLSGGDDDGSSQAAEAVQVAEDTGNAAFTVVALQAVALSHLTAGRAQQAAAVCERALAMGRAKRSGLWTESSLLAYLARARLETGDGDAAILAADEALAVARRQGAEVLESLALLTRAQVGRALGRAAAAAVDLAAALKLAIENGALTYEPFIREERGRLHGDGEDLREALRLHEAVGATGRARRLRRELEGSAVAPP